MRAALVVGCSLALVVVTGSARADELEPGDPEPARVDEARFRFGVSGSAGVGVFKQDTVGAFGVELRAGVQLSDIWAVLYQGVGIYGTQFVRLLGAPAELLAHASSILLEVTIADRVQIAIGPSLAVAHKRPGRDILGGGGPPRTAVGVGLSHRVAVTWRGTGPGTRQGFSLGLQLDAGWSEDHGDPGFGSLRLTLGWESF